MAPTFAAPGLFTLKRFHLTEKALPSLHVQKIVRDENTQLTFIKTNFSFENSTV